MYLVLFDKNWTALGSVTTYPCHSWSLTRRSYEMDSMTASCAQMEQSAKAVYCALYEDRGTLKWLGLSGNPKDADGVTTVNAKDIRNVFRQKILIDYSWGYGNGKSAKQWIEHLLGLPKTWIGTDRLGIDYDIDADAIALDSHIRWDDSLVPSEDEVADLWEVLQGLCMKLGFCIMVKSSITTTSGATVGSVTIKAVPRGKTYNIKLSDFGQAKVRNDSTDVNMAIVYDNVAHSVHKIYGITSYYASGLEKVTRIDNSTNQMLIAAGTLTIRRPMRAETFLAEYEAGDQDAQDEALAKAESEAQDALAKNLFKGSVTIPLNGDLATDMREGSRTGETDVGIQPQDMGKIYGYNSADSSSVRTLPVMSIREDGSGTKTVVFGRLDDYYYL